MPKPTSSDVFNIFQSCVAKVLKKAVEIPVEFNIIQHAGFHYVNLTVTLSNIPGIKINNFDSAEQLAMTGYRPGGRVRDSAGYTVKSIDPAEAMITVIRRNEKLCRFNFDTTEKLSKKFMDILILDPAERTENSETSPPTMPLSDRHAILKKILELCEKIYAKPLEDARD